MRIISDFHDYYDKVQTFGGHDATIIYERRETEVDRGSPFTRPTAPCIGDRECFFVVFCGQLHFGYREAPPPRKPSMVIQPDPPVIYRWNNFEVLKESMESEATKWRYFGNSNANFFEYFKRDHTDLCLEMRSPIVLFGHRGGWQRWSEHRNWQRCVVNPCLKRLQFEKAVDPFTAYQDLERFVDTHFTRSIDVAVVSDKDRFAEHGFDPKTSFRKDPWKKEAKKRR